MPVRSDKSYVEVPVRPAAQLLPEDSGRTTLAWKIIWALFAFAVYRFWIAPLPSSLWLDETGTFWAIRNGIGPMLHYIREWPTVTAVYGLIEWAAYAIGGAREYVLRLPSVISIGFATLLVYRLAKRLCGGAAALPAAVVFACAGPVAFAGADARVYALLLLAVAGSTLALVRWFETGSGFDAAVYVITAALVPHLHYLACPVLAVHAVYAVARYREGTPVRAGHLLAAGAGVAALVAPLTPFFLLLMRTRRELSFSPVPNIFDLAGMLAPGVLISAVLAGLAIAWMIGKLQPAFTGSGAGEPQPLQSAIVLMGVLAAGPVLLAYEISRHTSARIFIPRYVIESQVGVALVAGWLIGRIRPSFTRAIVTASILVFSIEAFGIPGQLWPLHGAEDWGRAAADVRKIAGNTQMPVFVQTGLIEATTLGLNFNGKTPSYMLAPLAFYPAAGRIILMPPLNSESGREYLETSLVPIAAAANRFLVLARDDLGSVVMIQARLPGYTGRQVDELGKVDLFLFTRRQEATRNLLQ